MNTKPNTVTRQWLSQFLPEVLIAARSYTIDRPEVDIKLDQNESYADWPEALKVKVFQLLSQRAWNRYPDAYSPGLKDLIAEYCGVLSHQVILGPGSNYLLSYLMDIFRDCQKVLAAPSFPHCEGHCRALGYSFEVWPLTKDFQYDPSVLPSLKPGSIVVFASPNNPVGNVLKRRELQFLLDEHPDTLFVADEAYFEFSQEPYTNLLQTYRNLIIVRTFAKALGAAGLRLGYLLAHSEVIQALQKPIPPYIVNVLTQTAVEVAVKDPEARKFFSDMVHEVVMARDFMFQKLFAMAKGHDFAVHPSEGNFLLMRWTDPARAKAVHSALVAKRVLIRDVSNPRLPGALRVTIGSQAQNEGFLRAFESVIMA